MPNKCDPVFPDAQNSVVVEWDGLKPIEVSCDWDHLAKMIKRHYLSTYPKSIGDQQKRKLAQAVNAYKRSEEERGNKIADDLAREQILLLYSEAALLGLRGHFDRFVGFGVHAALTAAMIKGEQVAHKSLKLKGQVSAAEIEENFAWLVNGVKRLLHATVGRPPEQDKEAFLAEIREARRKLKEYKADRNQVQISSALGYSARYLRKRCEVYGITWQEVLKLTEPI